MTRIVSQVQTYLKAILPNPPRILLAVSGGSDSMGLLHLMVDLKETLSLDLAVAVVNHGLRDVASEIALVEDTSRRLGLPFSICEIPKCEISRGLKRGSLQSWAREQRYALLCDAARKAGMSAIATGHTLDDQAETVMLRLLRGCGVDGLGGMRPVRPVFKDDAASPLLIRPLLSLQRDEIRAYLAQKGGAFADDPSNENDRFLRVRIRNELLPMMDAMQPGIAGRLAGLADDSAATVSFLSAHHFVEGKTYQRLRLGGGIKVSVDEFESLPTGLWGRVIRGALERVQGDLRRFERCHIAAIEQAVQGRRSTDALPLPGVIEAHVFRGNLFVFKSPLPRSPTGCGNPKAVGAEKWTVRFSGLGAVAEIETTGFEPVTDLVVRNRRAGDRVFNSKKKFKEVLIRAQVPRPYRDFLPVLALGDQILAAPTLLPCRTPALRVNWIWDENAPFLDVDFALKHYCVPKGFS